MIRQPTGGDWHLLGKVIEEYVHKIDLEGKLIWEEKLRLHIKPKPDWCPDSLWRKLVCMVVVQSIEKK